MNPMEIYVGIDVSKKSFDVHITGLKKDKSFDYTRAKVKECIKWLASLKPVLVLMEATGGYEQTLVAELFAASLPVKVMNPRRIRDFAKAKGQMAKTDKIDARIIADFAQTFQPPPQEEIDEISQKIKSLVSRRRQLVAMRVQELNRKEHAFDTDIAKSIDKLIKTFDQEIAKIESQISNHIDNSPKLKQKTDLLTAMKGIGKTTAMCITAELPEIGLLNNRQIASLIGVAPLNRDSGAFRGRRMTGGGRREVRTQLYMPTLVAIQHNPVIRAYYQHLLKNGKNKMVAVVACMRKLIITLNAMVAKNQPWIDNYA